MTGMSYFSLLSLIVLLFAAGCTHHVPPPTPPIVQPPISPLEGAWQTRHGDQIGQMIFKPGGELVFQGKLEFYNPGRWDWDPMRKKLTLEFPRADDKKLEIFYTLLNDGVQSFNPANKEVTYRFDDQTASLNVGGWVYTKVSTQKAVLPSEPTLK
jgi:hypothetical protein